MLCSVQSLFIILMKKSSFWKIFFTSYIFLFGSIVIASMIIFSYIRTYYQDYQVQQEISRLQEDTEKLKVKKLELLETLNYIKSPSFIEAKAKTELNMAKIGENMMIVQTASDTIASNGQVNKDMISLKSVANYIKWWNYFATYN